MANTEKLQLLFDAAEKGDEKTIKSLLEEGEVQIQMKYYGRTAMHVAVSYGHKNVVKLLGKSKLLLFLQDDIDRTPLHIAVYKNHPQIVEILCQMGAPVNINDTEGKSPLFIAVSKNRPEIVKCLLKYKAFMRCGRNYSTNIFHLALQKNYKSVVQILLHVADLIDICSCPSYPDPKFAEEVFDQCLGMQATTDCLSRKGENLYEITLYYAVNFGRDYQVKRLIDAGVNVNSCVFGFTPLDKAVIKRNVSMVEFLLTKMADVNNSGLDCLSTPLHYASLKKSSTWDLQQKDFEDSLEIMKILLRNGASVNLFDKNSRTPLHYAVEETEFRPEKIRLLFDYQADVNAHKDNQPTPIFFAKCGTILQMLIDKGANVNYKMSKIGTPLNFAFGDDNFTKVDIFLENGAEVDSCIIQILSKEQPEINEPFIDRIRDIVPAVEMLVKDRKDFKNIIPILVKRHFHGEVTINSEEFSSASGIFFPEFKECQEELERMRDVDVSNFSLLDILTMPIEELRNYTTNAEILKFFESRSIQEEFPVYSGMIMRRFKKAKEERDLIDSSWVALEKLIFSLHKVHLPDLVVHKIIIDFLHKVDWRNLVQL